MHYKWKNKTRILALIVLTLSAILTLSSCGSSHNYISAPNYNEVQETTYDDGYNSGKEAGYEEGKEETKEYYSKYENISLDDLNERTIDYIIDGYIQEEEFDKADAIIKILEPDYGMSTLLYSYDYVVDTNTNLLHNVECKHIAKLSTRYMAFPELEEFESYECCNDCLPDGLHLGY